MLRVENVSGGYDRKMIIKNVSFEVGKGEMLGILGPNGSGKSTLLKVISGILHMESGNVMIDGKSLISYSSKELAKKMAVLPQLHSHTFSHSVRDTIALGRYPHQTGLFSSWSAEDEEAVVEAMKLTAMERYEHQMLDLLSGGEQQRVFVAQALAQQAPILLLDEPTNHLDIAHQKQLLDTIKTQAIEKGITIISIFHDINLASLYCDRLLLMNQGEVKVLGAPQEVVKKDQIETVYKARISTNPHPERPKPQITILPDVNEQRSDRTITADNFQVTADLVVFQAETQLKTWSSAVINAGSGWYKNFVNRRVDASYACDNVQEEMLEYLAKNGFSEADTVGMMTAVKTTDAVIKEYDTPFGSIVIMVTAGVGNAVDVSRAHEVEMLPAIGTINTWIIVNGELTDEAFIQAVITATESKTKALAFEQVKDPRTGTIATGTSTDSVLIAATQKGRQIPYAGPITEIGKKIGLGVYECTVEAIQIYKKAKGWK
ncbi:iron complex transport system ATP-binding protein [Psychrobacillus sp. OK028]|uniref:adenosylcobinamide amidohydrolase n=1 Tax=Psychrobacillus sp. OK028 TaxID=1884359 RepID=UPI0008824F8B|nr:adenosylcobinamide amidohydrolase [Psychrobacillus sp. OK028]SDN25506.1 iron complex transport system ATP-binding protein [Psychrobacillus sp. OK028]